MRFPRSRPRPARRTGFTLVELLVVIALLAILGAILFPVFTTVRERGRQTVCRSQIRQIGMALAMYRQDHEALPPHLSTLLPVYVTDARLYICPSDGRRGQHDGNDYLEGSRYLASGVSYDYVPNWRRAQELGWWLPAPRYGEGRWGDLTPIARCNWHWATYFDKKAGDNQEGSRGWVFVLTAGGSVRRLRVEDPPTSFTPERYR